MTEQHPDQEEPVDDELPDPALVPPWIPVLIGAILVVMAGLAVYTGLRNRDDGSMAGHVRPRRVPAAASAPQGEPGAGASLVLPGGTDNVPQAGPPVQGRSRAVIQGDRSGVTATVRLQARRGMQLDVVPPESMVYVNDLPIGSAKQFDTADEVYDFAEPGSYNVRVVAPGGTERNFVVSATDAAADDVARIAVRLQ